jgi:hypothetical protein
MNERIQALALQAGYLKDMFGVGHWDMPECKKFAELIVRECISNVEVWEKDSRNHISYMLKQHFGVKE